MKKILITLAACASAAVLAMSVRSQLERQGTRSAAEDAVAVDPAVPAPASNAPAQVTDTPPTAPNLELRAEPPTPQPVATPAAEPQSSTAATALKKAAQAYAAAHSLRADFAQWQENPLLRKRTTSRGIVFQRQPDRFLMRFSEPAGDVIVSDGQYVWMYYPSVDTAQVLRTGSAAAGGLDLMAQFIGDPTERFSYTDDGREDVAARPARVITLRPKEPVGYRSLKVWIDERDHLVRRFELTNDNGVLQHFDLSNLQINLALADDLFRFTPPRGARIIER